MHKKSNYQGVIKIRIEKTWHAFDKETIKLEVEHHRDKKNARAELYVDCWTRQTHQKDEVIDGSFARGI